MHIVLLPDNVAKWEQIASAQAAGTGEAGDPVATPPLVLDAAGGYLIDATINGQPVRLLVSLRDRGIQLKETAAERLGITEDSSPTSIRLGKKTVPGRYATAEVAIGPVRSYPRIEWYDADVGAGADGVINIAYLPFPSVTLNLRPSTDADRWSTLPTEDRGGFAVVYRHLEGDRRIDIRPDLESAQTVLTTSTGAFLAERLGGTWTGPDAMYPIVHGINRPVRPMTFATPLRVGDFRIDNVLVRLRDYQGDDLLPAYDTGENEDENTIRVVGETDRTRAAHFLYLGRDVLGRCASITYVRETGDLRLLCPPSP
ncbi:hypothetical protein F7D01_00165 [Erythrobacter sp. 3-20A1M]|uniref:retropepsin-like domain-containing protein n=1 Tax=Erythrobacter sp. 3-20A1M TaxID=2653850 RepID=UPI001BFC7CD5|nr:retropepsin-like domain-containing protein [Erythrobacter sp. 3-20A1M]QWC55700.1 hypothetical protein F7D01_00165 [Erythrobacter sp. 3-20A1M]